MSKPISSQQINSQHNIQQLIITRPAGQADFLLKKLQSLGQEPLLKTAATQLNFDVTNLEVRHLPLIAVSPLAVELSETLELEQFNGAIFISGNAVKHFYSRFHQTQFNPDIELFAVGISTARQITLASGREACFPENTNSEHLLSLSALQNIKSQNWLIIKGSGGRKLIYDTLCERGATVTELDVYQRKLPDFTTQQLVSQTCNAQTVWLITSAEALTNLYRIAGLAENRNHATKIIVSSDRLATLATRKGFRIVAQATNASDSELVDCVTNFLLNQE